MAGYAFDRSTELCLDGQITRQSIHPIAAGGCADVWEGFFGNRKVAIKVARPFESTGRRMEQNKLLKRVWREYLVWSCLSHPNVLECLGFSHDFSPDSYLLPSLISPWMSNGTVISYLENNPEVDRLEILLGVAEGLSYLHARDPVLVHGDLRAGNILVSDRGVPCLSDFGLSRVLSEIRGMTTSAELAGTLRWMSPELLKADSRVSVSSDVWAYGMTVLEILSGERPYATVKNDIFILCELRDGGTPSRPQSLRVPEGLSEALWSLCQFCWSLEPTERPSMREVTAALHSLCSPPPYQPSLKPRNTCQPQVHSPAQGTNPPSSPQSVMELNGVRDEGTSLCKLAVDESSIESQRTNGHNLCEGNCVVSDAHALSTTVGVVRQEGDHAVRDMDKNHTVSNGAPESADIGTRPRAEGLTAETILRSLLWAVARGEIVKTTYDLLAFKHGVQESAKLIQQYDENPKRVTSIQNESSTVIAPPPPDSPAYSEFPPEPNIDFGRVILLGVPYVGQKRSKGRAAFYGGPGNCEETKACPLHPEHQLDRLVCTCRARAPSRLPDDRGARSRKKYQNRRSISSTLGDGVWLPPLERYIADEPLS